MWRVDRTGRENDFLFCFYRTWATMSAARDKLDANGGCTVEENLVYFLFGDQLVVFTRDVVVVAVLGEGSVEGVRLNGGRDPE
jgi:hypothetical protein